MCKWDQEILTGVRWTQHGKGIRAWSLVFRWRWAKLGVMRFLKTGSHDGLCHGPILHEFLKVGDQPKRSLAGTNCIDYHCCGDLSQMKIRSTVQTQLDPSHAQIKLFIRKRTCYHSPGWSSDTFQLQWWRSQKSQTVWKRDYVSIASEHISLQTEKSLTHDNLQRWKEKQRMVLSMAIAPPLSQWH